MNIHTTKIALWLIVLLVLTSKSVDAKDTLILCNNCSTSVKYTNMLLDHQKTNNKTYIIKDLEQRTIKKYRMMYEPEVNQSYPINVPVSNSEKLKFWDEVARWDYLRFNLGGLNYRSNINVNAYDLRMYPFFQNDIIKDYKENSTHGRELSNLMLSIASGFTIGKLSVGASYTFTIELNDQTIATVAITGFNQLTPKYTITKLEDSDGNEIPMMNLKDTRLVFRFKSEVNFNIWYNFMNENYGLEMNDLTVEWVKKNVKTGSVHVIDIDEKQKAKTTNAPDDGENPEEVEP